MPDIKEIRNILDTWAKHQIGDIVNSGEAACDIVETQAKEIERLREIFEKIFACGFHEWVRTQELCEEALQTEEKP